MPWLPDTDGRAIRLDLINVPTLNPDVLRLLDGLLYDYGLGDNRLLNDNGLLNDSRCRYDCRGGLYNDSLGIVRASQRRTDDTPDHSADETRPEMASATAPVAAVMMPPTVMMNRRRTMPLPAVVESPMRPGHADAGTQNRGKSRRYLDLLVHFFTFPFRLFGVYIPVGM